MPPAAWHVGNGRRGRDGGNQRLMRETGQGKPENQVTNEPASISSQVPCLGRFRRHRQRPLRLRRRAQGRHQAGQRCLCLHPQEQGWRDGELARRPQGVRPCWHRCRQAHWYVFINNPPFSFDLQKSTMMPSCLGPDAQMGLVEEKGGPN